jgi:hypothetical protein
MLDLLGVTPRRRALRDQPAKALAILGHQFVECVDDWRQSKRRQDTAERSGELDLSKEQHAPTPIARDRRAITEYKPPAFTAPFLWHRGEQAARLVIRERKQCEFLAPVKRGDDPRRPTAEPSAAGIEQNRAREEMGGHYAGARVLGHFHRGWATTRR